MNIMSEQRPITLEDIPPTFKDRVAPADAPAAVKEPEDRIKAVVKRYEGRSALADEVDKQPTPEEVEGKLKKAGEQAKAAEERLASVSGEADVALEKGANKIGFIRRRKGLRTAEEREAQVSKARGDLGEAEILKKRLEEADRNARLYSRGYLQKESDPNRLAALIEATNRGGPLKTSPEMTLALQRQKLIQEQAKYYQEKGLVDVDPDKRIPVEMYTELRESEGKSYYATPEAIADKIRVLTAFMEGAIDYADENNLSVDRELLAAAMDYGRTINKDLSSAGVFRFFESRRPHYVPAEIGYYAVGAKQLEEFFNKRGREIPEGEARVPYLIAYAGGVMEQGGAQHVIHHLRDWIVDTLPVSGTQRVRKEGEWVTEKTPPKPRGLGSFITPSHPMLSWRIENEGTSDEGLIEVMSRANGIVDKVDEIMRERRVHYSLQKNFHGEFGERLIKTPTLLTRA